MIEPSLRSVTRGFEQRLRRRLSATPMLEHEPIVVAFSGGPDSLALLAGLARIIDDKGRLLAVHVDHGLREGSAADQARAEALAQDLGVSFHGERLTEVLQRHPGVGLEEAARRERYLVLARLATPNPVGVIAVAHQQEDQAETVLLHLLRGSGLNGAAAMGEWWIRYIPWWGQESAPSVKGRRAVALWRPLLTEPRSVLQAYLDARGLNAIHDPSNDEVDQRRNALRHEALPILDRISPGATAALARYAYLVGDDARMLDGVAWRKFCKARRDPTDLDLTRLGREARPFARRMVRWWLKQSEGMVLSLERIDAILEFARTGREGRRLEIGNGRTVEIVDGALRVMRLVPAPPVVGMVEPEESARRGEERHE